MGTLRFTLRHWPWPPEQAPVILTAEPELNIRLRRDSMPSLLPGS